jgi:hypothetical protein
VLFCARRSCRRLARAGARIGGARVGNIVGDAATAARKRSAVQSLDSRWPHRSRGFGRCFWATSLPCTSAGLRPSLVFVLSPEFDWADVQACLSGATVCPAENELGLIIQWAFLPIAFGFAHTDAFIIPESNLLSPSRGRHPAKTVTTLRQSTVRAGNLYLSAHQSWGRCVKPNLLLLKCSGKSAFPVWSVLRCPPSENRSSETSRRASTRGTWCFAPMFASVPHLMATRITYTQVRSRRRHRRRSPRQRIRLRRSLSRQNYAEPKSSHCSRDLTCS